MAEQFISEAIRPEVNTIDTSRMPVGGPGLPQVFHWKTQTLRLARVVRSWHETGPCHHGVVKCMCASIGLRWSLTTAKS